MGGAGMGDEVSDAKRLTRLGRFPGSTSLDGLLELLNSVSLAVRCCGEPVQVGG